MKETRLSLGIGLICLLLLSGCDSESTPGFIDAATIDCAIEIQIAIRSEPYREGDGINEGDFRVVSSNVFPVHSTGGAGQVAGNGDGALMEMQWDRVRLQERRLDQHHSPEKRIAFDNFRYHIKNPIVLPNGTSYPRGLEFGEAKRTLLSNEFDLFCALTYSSKVEKKDRLLVIRARLLPKTEAAKPLMIPQTLDVETENAG